MIFKSVSIISKESAEEFANKISEYMKNKGIEVKKDLSGDIIIILGGDGTILKACSKLKEPKPILGINFGTKGFLAEVLPEEWKNSIEKILKGDYIIDERRKIDVFINGEKIGEALNEVVVIAEEPVRMLNLDLFINGELVDSLRADGVIIATPTGSTAYSMSAGGAIIDPETKAFIITFICPFKLGSRSIVVPDEKTIKVVLKKSKCKALVVVDGKKLRRLNFEDEILAKLSRNVVRFIRFKKEFYKKVRERL